MLTPQHPRGGQYGRRAALVVIAAFLPALCPVASGQCEEEKLLADDAAAGALFGAAIAADGDTLITGATLDADNGTDAGAVHAFVLDAGAWVQQGKLLPATGAVEDVFGSAVALDADVAVGGAPLADFGPEDSGAAYVFRRNGSGVWNEEDQLLDSGAGLADRFGSAVAISGAYIAVGAPLDDTPTVNAGSVVIYTFQSPDWNQVVKLTAPDGDINDEFGAALALDGDTLLVGAARNDEAGTVAGAVYVFQRTGAVWNFVEKLLAGDAANGDLFGSSVALDGDVALIGAPGDDDMGSGSGAVYAFTRLGGSFQETAKLVPDDGQLGDQFGFAVALSGTRAVVGAPRDDDGGADAGAVYPFRRAGDDWRRQGKIVASGAAAGHFLGETIALADVVAVGSRLDDEAGANAGAAWVHEFPCATDTNGDCATDVGDLVAVILDWGAAGGAEGDVDGSGLVDVGDLVTVILAWGDCP